MTPFGQSQEFQVIVDGQDKMNPPTRIAWWNFQTKVARLQRALQGATQAANSLTPRFAAIRRALLDTPNAPEKLLMKAIALRDARTKFSAALSGDQALRARNMNLPPSINERVGEISRSAHVDGRPTQTQIDQYAAAAAEFEGTLNQLGN